MSVEILKKAHHKPQSNSYLNYETITALKKKLVYTVVPLFIFCLWWVASNQLWMPSQILPTPQQTWASFIDLIKYQNLIQHIQVSAERLAIGVILGILGGVLFGACLGLSQRFETYSSMSFYAIAIIPTLAWLPLLMMWLGIEEALKYFLIFKAVFIPIAIHVQTGLKEIHVKLREVTNVLTLSKWQILKILILPAVLPYFFTGLRIALASGWTTLVAVELIASSEGIGYLMVTGRQLFQLDIVFVMIFIIASVGIFIDYFVSQLEKKIIFWPHAALSIQPEVKQNNTFWQPCLFPLLILIIWCLIGMKGWVSPELLPTPRQVLNSFFESIQRGDLVQAALGSLSRAMQGLLLGGLLGTALGIAVGTSIYIQRLFAPTLNTLRLIAIFAWIPLLTAWFGLGDFSKTIFIALATFFPMFVASWQGVKGLSKQLHEVSMVLNLSFLDHVFKFILPSITPSLFSGLRLALLYAWMASFGAEYLMGSGVGLGTYLMSAQQSFEMERVISATILVAMLGLILAYIGQFFENKATVWRRSRGE